MDFGLLYENDKGEYVVLNDVRMADIRLASLVYLLVYVSTYCVPIAHLRQNKPFPLLYLGHVQIKNFRTLSLNSEGMLFGTDNFYFILITFSFKSELVLTGAHQMDSWY